MAIERNRVEIDLDNFAHNIEQLKALLHENTAFMQIVKADAYGHGAYEIAKMSISLGAAYLGVANAEEGALLRYQGISLPILILSPSLVDEIKLILEHNLTPAVSDYNFALQFNDYLSRHNSTNRYRIHIEVDTGMGRTGLDYQEAAEIINRLKRLKHLEVEGIFSHYSSAEIDYEYTALQQRRFNDVVNSLDFPIKYIHIDNSAGVVTNQHRSDESGGTNSPLNLVRLGLLTYGIYPDPSLHKLIDLQPVMSFISAVCQIRTVVAGESVGYNRTFVANRDTSYGVIPVGYADGYDFLLSNNSAVSIKGHLCPVIGRISMDMITVDITDYPDIAVGDEVILIKDGVLRPENIVRRYRGLAYELVSQIGRRAKRYYQRNGEITTTTPLARRDFVSTDFTDDKLNRIIESAIGQRLQSTEIASLLYEEVLNRFFADKDRNVHYRKNFVHQVEFLLPQLPAAPNSLLNKFLEPYGQDTVNKFLEPYGQDTVPVPHTPQSILNKFYEVNTTLSFSKVLPQDYFIVACATRLADLKHYFRRRDVEYRWLLDNSFSLSEEFFQVTKASVDDLELTVSVNDRHSSQLPTNSLEIRCSNPGLTDYVGREVVFSISTKTFYPRSSNHLTIYITELTKGIKISFRYPGNLCPGVVPIFSGQDKYPHINQESPNCIELTSKPGEWIFPNSGVVFTY